MVAYGIAKARAMANRTDWNERTEITKAVITWFDEDYEYDWRLKTRTGWTTRSSPHGLRKTQKAL